MIFKTSVPLFGGSIHFILDETQEAVMAWAAKKKIEVDPPDASETACTLLVDSHIIIWFIRPSKKLTHGVVAHEVYHAVCEICRYAGVTHSESSEETYAYLIHDLVNKFYKKTKLSSPPLRLTQDEKLPNAFGNQSHEKLS